ncbi:2Fe-2S iron-sulfur cluster binding domain-containing protein [Xenorhabdus sp. 18]|uniref:2Fe-2S iron-sulfur cluster-binding protein n=1 Tax=Xenorhabdus doucetiae TaxID=351671 RepID=UPI0019B4ADD1|nr:2Fe-2S iron-sulfur cluster-binding protein [Xenorhabdus sp. 18]MBD2796402.1 2Fe-2S iron-sulfur cluster binding domain-containing protein [Xenorhabdus sp. 18]
MNLAMQAYCERVILEAGDVKVFTLRAQNTQTEFLSTLQPGKHVAIQYPDTFGSLKERLYSITRKQDPDLFEIAVKRSGHNGVSDNLHATIQEGSIVPLQYVAGDISIESIIDYKHIGMIAGGIGITLPLALLRELAVQSRDGRNVPNVVLLLCIPRISEISFLHELLELELTMKWFTFRIFLTQENIQENTHFIPGRPSIDSLNILAKSQAIIICGSYSFASDFREKITKIFPSSQQLIEAFSSPKVIPVEEKIQSHIDDSLKLHVADNGKIIDAILGKSLLEILESNNISIKSQCRSGICGSCRIKISNGECQFEPDFCLSDEDKRNGYALACCTFPLSGNITINLALDT